MSVLVAKRREAKTEPMIFAEDLHSMLIDLMHRNFGIKNIYDFVRVQYAHKVFATEDFEYYAGQMSVMKHNMNNYASLLSANLRSAYYRYPTNLHEWQIRRDHMNDALVNCHQMERELQKVVDVFKVDVNAFHQVIAAIYKEIDLIKRWRQRDNKIKASLEKKAASE